MQSIGKTIMVELPDIPEEITDGGIIIPSERSANVIHFKGIVNSYGTGWNKDDIKRLSNEIPISSVVYFDWKTKENKIKISMNQKWYMVLPESLILGVEINE